MMFRSLLITIAFTACMAATTKQDTKCDIRTFQVKSGATLDGCKTQCEATANCGAYTFNSKMKGGYCMGCALDSTEKSQPGFVMHCMPITHSTPTPDTKCGGTDRIFAVKTGMTRDTCKAQCENTAYCEAYAFRSNGYCMGCSGMQLHQPQKGFDMHELIRHSTPTPDTKCNGADRIFSVKTGMTRDTCKAQCENTANCMKHTRSGALGFAWAALGSAFTAFRRTSTCTS